MSEKIEKALQLFKEKKYNFANSSRSSGNQNIHKKFSLTKRYGRRYYSYAIKIISSLIRTLPSVQESHLLGAEAYLLRSRTLPPVWNFTNPQRYFYLSLKL